MESLEDVIRAITAEMQKSISAKTVVGDPVTFEGKTIIPLISVGMGFGAGTGTGKSSDNAGGGGGGGGMAIRPVAVVVIDENGVKLETLKSPPEPQSWSRLRKLCQRSQRVCLLRRGRRMSQFRALKRAAEP